VYIPTDYWIYFSLLEKVVQHSNSEENLENRETSCLTPVAGLILETKNREIFLERFFWREITAREQVSRAVILEKI